MGDQEDWPGISDGFAEIGVDIDANTRVEPTAVMDAPAVPDGEIVCIDRVDIDKRECYADELALCVSGCKYSCKENIFRTIYSDELYEQFLHLFGRVRGKHLLIHPLHFLG